MNSKSIWTPNAAKGSLARIFDAACTEVLLSIAAFRDGDTEHDGVIPAQLEVIGALAWHAEEMCLGIPKVSKRIDKIYAAEPWTISPWTCTAMFVIILGDLTEAWGRETTWNAFFSTLASPHYRPGSAGHPDADDVVSYIEKSPGKDVGKVLPARFFAPWQDNDSELVRAMAGRMSSHIKTRGKR